MAVSIFDSPKMNRPESLGPARNSGGYDPTFFDQLALVEERHFWFRARNRLIFQFTERISAGFRPGSLILEVGCGTGNVLSVLQKACPMGLVVGLELWSEALRYARKRGDAFLVQGDVRQCPFRNQFDLIGLFDVLEHIDEEQETLDCIWRLLVPGGALLLTVPAHQSLWSYFDEAAHHCRRYSPDEIGSKLSAAGFEVEFQSQFMACLFPLVWTFRKLQSFRRRRDPGSAKVLADDEFRVVPLANGFLTGLLNLEVRWLTSGHRLPIGTSVVVVARKPSHTQTISPSSLNSQAGGVTTAVSD